MHENICKCGYFISQDSSPEKIKKLNSQSCFGIFYVIQGNREKKVWKLENLKIWDLWSEMDTPRNFEIFTFFSG